MKKEVYKNFKRRIGIGRKFAKMLLIKTSEVEESLQYWEISPESRIWRIHQMINIIKIDGISLVHRETQDSQSNFYPLKQIAACRIAGVQNLKKMQRVQNR